jgi:hypothetical protein
MKILFLDVDNVLNDDFTSDYVIFDGNKYNGLDTDKIERLNQIIEATGAKIVLSSSWREDDRFVDYLKERMGKVNPALPDLIIGETDIIPTFGRSVRHEEIQRWINKNAKKLDVERFVILDDISSEGLRSFGKSFVLTKMCMGLTDEIADQCIQVLNA